MLPTTPATNSELESAMAKLTVDFAALDAASSELPAFGTISGGLSDPKSWQRQQLAAIHSYWSNLPLALRLVLLATAIIEQPYPEAQIYSLLQERDLLPVELPTTILCETLYCTNCARLINLPEPVESATIGCVQRCVVCNHNSFLVTDAVAAIKTPIGEVPATRNNWLPATLGQLPASSQLAIHSNLMYQRVFISNAKLAALASN